MWVRYAAYPYQKFGMAQGIIRQISTSPIAPQDLPPGQAQALLNGAQSNEPLYRIEVELSTQTMMAYGQAQHLVAGMTLEADLIQDNRTIGELLFEPLIAAEIRHRSG